MAAPAQPPRLQQQARKVLVVAVMWTKGEGGTLVRQEVVRASCGHANSRTHAPAHNCVLQLNTEPTLVCACVRACLHACCERIRMSCLCMCTCVPACEHVCVLACVRAHVRAPFRSWRASKHSSAPLLARPRWTARRRNSMRRGARRSAGARVARAAATPPRAGRKCSAWCQAQPRVLCEKSVYSRPQSACSVAQRPLC